MLLPGFRIEQDAKSMGRTGVLLAMVLVVMLPMLLVPTPRSVQIHSAAGERIWCSPVNAGDTLQLQFTHSMFGGFVREDWQVTPANQLQRDRFVTQNAAAAEYYATDGTSYQAEDGFVVPGDPMVESELIVRVNTRGNHIVSVNSSTIQLGQVLPRSTQVRISIESQSCKDAP